jgi:hypothetical protein
MEHGSCSARIAAYRRERDALLQQLRAVLEADGRVTAAWLFGSLGRGAGDALSDIDLFVVVADQAIPAVVGDRRSVMAQVAQVGEPLLIVEAPQNAPLGGAYQMALYPGADGPHQVDWYWQPHSAARVPQQTHLLFDRTGLPRLDGPTRFERGRAREREPLEATIHAVASFWAMLLITAKYAARSPLEDRMELLQYVYAPLREVERFAGAVRTEDAGEPHPEPAAKIRLLRQLAARMTSLTPPLAAAGIAVPAGIAPQAECFLRFVAEEWFGLG